jgi:hypothetical protein
MGLRLDYTASRSARRRPRRHLFAMIDPILAMRKYAAVLVGPL